MKLTLQEAQRILSGVHPDKVLKIYEAVCETVGEEQSEVYEETNEGIYNSIAVPETISQVVDVTDESEEPMTVQIVYQQVVADRNYEPPVSVEYVTVAEARRHLDQMIIELKRRSKDV